MQEPSLIGNRQLPRSQLIRLEANVHLARKRQWEIVRSTWGSDKFHSRHYLDYHACEFAYQRECETSAKL